MTLEPLTESIPPSAAAPTYTRAVDFMAKIENELGLLDLSFFGAPIWPSIRNEFFVLLLIELGAYEKAGQVRPQARAARSRFDEWIRRNPLLRWSSKRFVVLGSPIVYLTNRAKVDIYTDDLIADLPPHETEIIRLENDCRGYREEKTPAYGNYTISILVRAFRTVRAFCIKHDKTESRAVAATLAEVKARTRARFGFAINLDSLITNAVLNYHAQRAAWRLYFLLRRPEYVIISFESYASEGIIRAAHESGAAVIELQHGLVGWGHMGYHFPGRPVVRDRPDLMLMFGPKWIDAAELPQNTMQRTYGFAPISRVRQRLAAGELIRSKQVAVLSSIPFHADLLIQVVEQIAQSYPLHRVIVRPHAADRFNYADRLRSIGGDRISVSSNIQPVHELIAQSEYVLSGPSTVLFEALALGCKVICLAVEFEPIIRPLVAGTPVRMIRNVDELIPAMQAAEPAHNSCGFYADKTSSAAAIITASLGQQP